MTKKKIPEESSLCVRMELSGRIATPISVTRKVNLSLSPYDHVVGRIGVFDVQFHKLTSRICSTTCL
jgi:hypothetical protein